MHGALLRYIVFPRSAARLSWLRGALLALACAYSLGASAAEPVQPPTSAASEAAASEVAVAPLVQAIDQVIQALEDDTQRTALPFELHRLRDGVTPLAASEAAAAEVEKRGLIGVLSNVVENADKQLRTDQVPVRYWSERFERAAEQLPAIFMPAGATSVWPGILDFLTVTVLWVVPAAGLFLLGDMLMRRRGIPTQLGTDPTIPETLRYAARILVPWAVGFILAITYTRAAGRTPASVCAMLLASMLMAGAFFHAASMILFSLLSAGRRKTAAQILKRHARMPLAVVGALVVLADSATDSRVVAALGFSVAALVTTAANIGAALLIAWYAIRFQRVIGHLFTDRPAEYRQAHRTSHDTAMLAARYWHLPILAIVLTSVAATLIATGNAEIFLQRTVTSAALFVLTILVTSMISRTAQLPPQRGARQRRSPYLLRFLKFLRAVFRLFVWIVFLELCARVWGTSLVTLAGETLYGQEISKAMTSITVIVFLAWLVWLIMDTAITEALTPQGSKGRAPSTRARTILPLIRNVAFITVVVVAAIATLANLGVNVTPLLAGAGVVGLAIGFGAQTLVQDLITGLFIIIEDTIAVGDSIDVGTHAGTVEALTIRTVRLRDLSGAMHVIPFSAIKTIKNMSRGYGYAVFNISVAYASDIDHVISVIRDVGAQMMSDYRYQLSILEPIEILGLDRFEASGVVVLARIRTRASSVWEITRAFNLMLKRRFDQEGIEMPLPQMMMHQAVGGATPKDSEPPAAVTPDDLPPPKTSP